MNKFVAVACFQAFLAHAIFAQCIGNLGLGLPGTGIGLANGIGTGLGLGATGIGAGCLGATGLGLNNAAVSNGGGFTVTSSSPIAPSGVSVVSEYVIEGPVNVGGQLPVLGTVALEGALPTGGAAGTTYSCGNGNVGITSETGAAGVATTGVATGLGANGLGATGLGATGLGATGFGFGAGLGSGLGAINRIGAGCGAY